MLALADQSQPRAIRGLSAISRCRKMRAARKALRRGPVGVSRWRGRSYLSVSVKTEKHTLALSNFLFVFVIQSNRGRCGLGVRSLWFPAACCLCSLRDSESTERREMSAVQLLRVSVHERITAAAEDFLLQVEKRGAKAQVPALRAMLTERLTAAVEEILAVLEETVAEYEDRVERSELENCRQRRLLDTVMQPVVQLHRADVEGRLQSQWQIRPFHKALVCEVRSSTEGLAEI
ncbi:unnamed protein product [Pleuronectes platessa]|uniref:Uncharacterized protein n=1 Tax=Pleuronectes platessa TaxID=8262 RepID=A0A9N7Y5R2_PLEPL|nr:unnamed protein product [Pleuronectes platessa]